MILKALADYYDRLLNDPDCDIPPFGFEKKAIPFLIVLREDGTFANVRDTRTGDGKKKEARLFLVPQGEKKAASIKANLLWDAPQYVLGVPKGDSERHRRRAREALAAFKARIDDTFPTSFSDKGIRAVRAYLNAEDFSGLFAHSLWEEIAESQANLSFKLEHDDTQLVSQRNAVHARIQASVDDFDGRRQTCAVTGEPGIPATLHQAIKGVWGAQSVGANIVSFNLHAFESFGKKQGLNAPMSERTTFAYTTALNYLLRKGSPQRMQVGDASTVFWARETHALEDDFLWLLGEPPKGEEDVAYGKIRALLEAVRSGVLPEEDRQSFYVLGLAPNAARIAVRFWHAGNIAEIKSRIARHFADIEIVRAPHDREFLSLFQLLVSTATEGKADNIAPNLGGDAIRAVLSGRPYPRTLLANAIRRCKAEQRITHPRASIIKGVLAREARLSQSTEKEVSVALDRQYDNIGYVLGRLFAVLERVQEEAHRPAKLNKTIRDTYFGAAASSPLLTFKRLQDLAIHHLAKIRNSGKSTVWLEQQMQEVSGHIPPQGYPPILNLEDQGRFSIGYYHQRQDFFTKKDNEGGEEE